MQIITENSTKTEAPIDGCHYFTMLGYTNVFLELKLFKCMLEERCYHVPDKIQISHLKTYSFKSQQTSLVPMTHF